MVIGCAAVPTDPEELAEFQSLNDPLEPANRGILKFNQAVDSVLFKPVAKVYRAVVPSPARTAVHNVLSNLDSPFILINDALQGEGERAATTFARFFVNSTLGILGIFDVAGSDGLPYHSEDFGQTMAVWGIPAGPYLVLPVLGPSSPRDAVGVGVGFVADPVDIVLSNNDLEEWSWARTGVGALDQRESLLDRLDDLERTSLDYYAALRSVYRQYRADEIKNSPKAVKSPNLAERVSAMPSQGIDSVTSAPR